MKLESLHQRMRDREGKIMGGSPCGTVRRFVNDQALRSDVLIVQRYRLLLLSFKTVRPVKVELNMV